MSDLATLDIPGHGPYVFGRLRNANPSLPLLSSGPSVPAPKVFSDLNAIRDAAKTLHPVFKGIGDILGNDRWGVCTVVAALKMQMLFDSLSSDDAQFRIPTLDDVIWLYKKFNPDFDPQTGDGDNGCELEDIINWWLANGLYQDGHGKIKAAYRVDASNQQEVEDALAKYGLLYVGCELPTVWPQIVKPGFIWSVEGPSDPTLGHATFWYGGNLSGVFDSTWAMEGTILWPAVKKYFALPTGEVYAVVPV